MPAPLVLVINAGSSSIKLSAYRVDGDAPERVFKGHVEGIGGAPSFRATNAAGTVIGTKDWPGGAGGHAGVMRFLVPWIEETLEGARLAAIGHRVVHGGTRYAAPTLVTLDVMTDLRALEPLAPLHQPHNLAPIEALAAEFPDLPQVACFDTAFHRDNPEVAQAFAIPWQLAEEEGIRRYGFHGLSYEYIASVLPGIDPRAATGRTIVAHLGNGASLCALRNGRSVASTMGFTAVDGLPMGTRTGALDPGVVLYLMQTKGFDAKAVEDFLYRRSGLLGLSGVSNDMRTLLASADPRAAHAVAVFCYRILREIGSLAAALGGLDALVFTAGIGEHAAPVRARVCEGLEWLGLTFDAAANESDGPRISASDSRVSAWVVPTDEEVMIARHAARVAGLG